MQTSNHIELRIKLEIWPDSTRCRVESANRKRY